MGKSLENRLYAMREGEVHVWHVYLNVDRHGIQEFYRLLAADELRKAQRFHFQREANRFIVSHGALRLILGYYLKECARRIRYAYGAQGKPYLAEVPLNGNLQFNISHSHELALIAVSGDSEVGIDIEYVRPLKYLVNVARDFFSPFEVNALLSLPESLQEKTFYTCWTRKEALVKAKGGGLSIPLAQFDVSIDPEEPARLLNTRWDADEAQNWRLQDIKVCPQYAAAIAVKNRDLILKHYDFSSNFINH